MAKRIVVQKANDGQDIEIKTPNQITFTLSKELAIIQLEGFKIHSDTCLEAISKALDGNVVEIAFGRNWSTVNTISHH